VPQPDLTRRLCLAVFAAVAVPNAHADLATVIAANKPSVVAIGTFSATDSPRFTFRGTGFVVGGGTSVITNFHVLPPETDSTTGRQLMVQVVRGPNNLEGRPARVVATDRTHDLALLRIDGAPLPALPLGDAEPVPEGTAVAFTGFPIGGVLGYSHVTHRGIVASVTRIALPAATSQQLSARALAELRNGAFEIYQLDATAYPGNSGGPVYDVMTGRVIGVINMVLVRGTRESALTNPTGISYAIPVRFVRELLDKP
jgi:serine protease Do